MNLNHSYWKANKALSKQIAELLAEEDLVMARALELASRFPGASTRNVYYERSAFKANLRVVGLIFKNEADVPQNLFSRLEGSENGWRPHRKTAAARRLDAEFRQLQCGTMGQIADLLKLPTMIPVAGGIGGVTISTTMVKNTAYIGVPLTPRRPLKNCQRISDLTFERVVNRVRVNYTRWGAKRLKDKLKCYNNTHKSVKSAT